MNKKRVIGTLLALLLVLAPLTGCGKQSTATSGSNNKKIKIGFINTNLSNEFQVYMKSAAEAKAKELGVEFVGLDGQGDAAKQISQAESLISQKVDAIVMAPTDSNACAPVVDKAVAANIPIIIVNSLVSNIDKATAYVGSNDVEAGTIEMKYAADLLKGKGNIVIMHGPMGNSAEVQRTQGIKQILAKNPNIKLLAEQSANWDRAQGMALMENWIQAKLDINCVVAQNDEMGIGAYNAIEAAGKKDKIKVIGIDAIPDALKAVEDGKFIATVFQDAKGQGAKAIEIANLVASGKTVQKKYFIPFQLVTKANLANFKK
ncbi:MAG TPA: substrate-binding domain-containing protein [Clostridium sp.]|uniref:substrate-binding domain-containing protein n=1 Tax=Clostridium sp. TaxID=1506 RepID=UPI002F93324C